MENLNVSDVAIADLIIIYGVTVSYHFLNILLRSLGFYIFYIVEIQIASS